VRFATEADAVTPTPYPCLGVTTIGSLDAQGKRGRFAQLYKARAMPPT